MAKLVMCVASAWVSETQMVQAGRLYRADDTLVLENPGLFDEDLDRYAVGDQPAYQTATAEPGEPRRGPGRPRKDA